MYILYYTETTNIIEDIIFYLSSLKYSLQPTFTHRIPISEYDNNKYPIIVSEKIYYGESECIRFLTEQSCIIHLKDKAVDFKNRYDFQCLG